MQTEEPGPTHQAQRQRQQHRVCSAAWRLRLLDQSGAEVTWRAALTRFAAAIVSWLALGLGFWWSLVDRDGQTWHDRWSGTRLVILAKGGPRSGNPS